MGSSHSTKIPQLEKELKPYLKRSQKGKSSRPFAAR